MYCIFRKADGVLLYCPSTQAQFDAEWQACLTNEGGTADDYEIVESDEPVPKGMLATLVSGNIILTKNPALVQREATQSTLRAKLAALGFTPEEIGLLR